MITIKSLTFSNVLSYEETPNTLVFEDRVLQLIGENGAGKSSIPTILEEVFYNKNSRGIKKSDLLNRYTEGKTYSIATNFEKDGSSYEIQKNVASTAKVKLFKDGEDISGHTATQTYAIIEEIIGLDFPTFSKLVYQSMVSSLDFLTATDANRKKFLVSLLGLDKYVDIEKLLKAELKNVKEESKVLEGSIAAHESWINSPANTPIPVEPKIELPVVDESITDSIEELIANKATIDARNATARANALAKQALDNFNASARVAKPTDVPTDEELLAAEKEHEKLKHQLVVLNSEVAKLSQVRDKCHACGSPIDVGDAKIRLQKAVQESSELSTKVTEALNVFNTIKQKISAYSSWEMQEKKYQQLVDAYDPNEPIEPESADDINQQINELRMLKRTQETAYAAAVSHNNNIAATEAKNQLLEEQKATVTEKLVYERGELSSMQEVMARLEVLTAAFGSKGLIAYKIESTVKVFEDLINEYLQILADGRFALGFQVEDSKLLLKLFDDGEAIDIKSLSSGEFSRVNTATLLAVRKMLTAISKVDINLLFLDEVVSVLDQQGKDTLIDVLLRERNLNSIVVSHGYAHPLAEKLHVIKENQISRIENGQA